MDIKVQGITLEVMTEALAAAGRGRKHVLERMRDCDPAPSGKLGDNSPRLVTTKVKDRVRVLGFRASPKADCKTRFMG